MHSVAEAGGRPWRVGAVLRRSAELGLAALLVWPQRAAAQVVRVAVGEAGVPVAPLALPAAPLSPAGLGATGLTVSLAGSLPAAFPPSAAPAIPPQPGLGGPEAAAGVAPTLTKAAALQPTAASSVPGRPALEPPGPAVPLAAGMPAASGPSPSTALPDRRRGASVALALRPPAAGLAPSAPGTDAPATAPRSLSERVWAHAGSLGFVRHGRPVEEVPLGAPAEAARGGLGRPQTAEPRPAEAGTAKLAAPAAARQEGQSGRGLLRAAPVRGFLSSLLVQQLGLEAFALAVPQLAKSLSESFLSLSLVSLAALGAYALGSLLAGPFVDRLGVRKVYLAAMGSRLVASTALAALFINGAVSLPVLIALFGVDYLLLGAARTAEATLPAVLLGSDPLPLNRFGTLQQVVIEGIGILGPLAAGFAIATWGFGSVLAAYPALFVMALWLAARTLRLPPGKVEREKNGSYREALAAVLRSPALRWGALGFTLSTAITHWLYFMIAPAFGLFVAGSPQAAAGVNAWVTSLYAAGGFAGAWVGAWINRRLEARAAAVAPEARAAEGRRQFQRSAALWLGLDALGTLGLWALLWASPIGGFLPAYVAMPLTGLAAVVAYVQLETLLKSLAPEGQQGTVLGVVRAGATAVSVLGLFALGLLFDASAAGDGPATRPTAASFLVLGLGATLAAALYALAGRCLWRQTRKGSGAKR